MCILKKTSKTNPNLAEILAFGEIMFVYEKNLYFSNRKTYIMG